MRVLQVLLILIWSVVAVATILAANNYGVATFADPFSEDLAAGSWRTQYNVDLLAHLFLIGLWAAWRQGFSAVGIIAGLFCTFGGSLFSFLFIVVLSARNKGDMRKILMGVHS